MELVKVRIDHLAKLMGRDPKEMREQFGTLGLTIPADGYVDVEDVQLALWDLGEDWERSISFETVPTYADDLIAKEERPIRLYDDLAEVELDIAARKLVSPKEPERIRGLACILDENGEYATEAALWSAAYKAAVVDTGDSAFRSECKLNYAVTRSKALVREGRYEHAAEMAFAALACGQGGCALEAEDERAILYFLGILLAENVIGNESWADFSMQDLILTGLNSDRRATLERMHNAILRALFLYDNFVERLDFPKDVRVTIRKSLDVLKGDLEGDPDFRGEALYSQLAQDITEHILDLRNAIASFLSVHGYAGLTQYRSRLIVRFQDVRRFAAPAELEVIEGLLEILMDSLTELAKQRDGGNVREYGRTHANILEVISNLARQIEDRPGWLSSCYVLPVFLWLKECLIVDFRDRTSVYTTMVALHLSKKEYPLQKGEAQTLVIAARNEGNSPAEQVTVRFQPTSDAALSPTSHEYGELAVGSESTPFLLRIQILDERAVYEIPYTLSWRNVVGAITTQSSTLKLLPQKHIDWAKYTDNPYRISSIKEYEANRLKGRSDKLAALRLGLSSMQSFFITGQKRVGKSSIANVYYGELLKKDEVLPVRFLWGDVADCDLPMLGEAMCRFVKDAWQDKLNTRYLFPVPSIYEFKRSFSRTFSDFLLDFHRRYPTWKLIFIIDDFDEIREDLYRGETGDVFFTTLRAFIDRDFTSFIITASEKLSNILRQQGRKVNQADVLELDYLDHRKDLEDLITEPAREVLFFDQDAITAVIELTAGNPYYTNLLCSRIFRAMVEAHDYYVSRSDVMKAAQLLAREDKEKSYDHFWTDGIDVTGSERERIAYNNAMVLIAMSKSETDAGGYVDIQKIYQQPEVRHMETAELEYRLNELADRKVIERAPSSPNRFRLKVKLFGLWLQSGGAHLIRQSFGQIEYTIRPMKDYAIFPEEIASVAEGLVYRGENIDRILVETWLRQFGDDYNQRLAYKVLSALKERGYYSIERFNNALETLFKKAVARTSGWGVLLASEGKKLARNVLVCHIDPEGKSGPAIVTEFRRVNQIYYKLCGSLEEISEILAGISELSGLVGPNQRWLLMMVDDFVGSGNAGAEYIGRALELLDQKCPGWDSRCHTFYGFVSGFEKGAEVVEATSNQRVSVVIADPLEEKDRCFSPEAKIFQDDRERGAAKALFQKIGESLEKKHPLGHEGSEALIVLPMNVPNNTLPVFYKQGRYEGRLWTPLFLRV